MEKQTCVAAARYCKCEIRLGLLNSIVSVIPPMTRHPSPNRCCLRLRSVLKDWIHLVFQAKVTLRLEDLERERRQWRDFSLFFAPIVFCTHEDKKKKKLFPIFQLFFFLLISPRPDLLLLV